LLAELQQLAIGLGFRSNPFAGRLTRSEIKQIFYSAQSLPFHLSPSRGVRIVQIEAMAAGLPIVNTNLATTVPLVARHDLEALTVHQITRKLCHRLESHSRRARAGRKTWRSWTERAFDEFDQLVFRARMARPMKPPRDA